MKNEKLINDIAETSIMMMDGVTTVADTKGVTSKELEAVYNVGYAYYTTGRYDEAEKIFNFLCAFEHTNSKYWTAFGAVRQAKKKYDEALKAYAAASFFDMHAPKPHYYAAECAFILKDLDSAESAARSLLELCPANEKSIPYRTKAEKLLAIIKTISANRK